MVSCVKPFIQMTVCMDHEVFLDHKDFHLTFNKIWIRTFPSLGAEYGAGKPEPPM